jgi:predicted MFS family arabinose efflux permease
VVLVLALHFLIFACMANLQALLPLFVEARLSWGAREVGALFAGSALLALVVQGGLIEPITRALPAPRALLAGSALLAVAMAALYFARAALPVLAALAGAGVGLGVATPMLTLLALAAAPRDAQGVVLGLAQSSAGFGRALAPLAGGALHDAAGAGAPFAGCAVAALAACAVSALCTQADEVEVSA